MSEHRLVAHFIAAELAPRRSALRPKPGPAPARGTAVNPGTPGKSPGHGSKINGLTKS